MCIYIYIYIYIIIVYTCVYTYEYMYIYIRDGGCRWSFPSEYKRAFEMSIDRWFKDLLASTRMSLLGKGRGPALLRKPDNGFVVFRTKQPVGPQDLEDKILEDRSSKLGKRTGSDGELMFMVSLLCLSAAF